MADRTLLGPDGIWPSILHILLDRRILVYRRATQLKFSFLRKLARDSLLQRTLGPCPVSRLLQQLAQSSPPQRRSVHQSCGAKVNLDTDVADRIVVDVRRSELHAKHVAQDSMHPFDDRRSSWRRSPRATTSLGDSTDELCDS